MKAGEKATEKESRRHTISSATQLLETDGKQLALASVQLTRTSEGGQTLAEAIAGLRGAITDPELSGILRSRLQLSGVVPENEGNYTNRWTLRTPIEFYRAGHFSEIPLFDFPASVEGPLFTCVIEAAGAKSSQWYAGVVCAHAQPAETINPHSWLE